MKCAGVTFIGVILSISLYSQRVHLGLFGGVSAYNGDLTTTVFPKKVTNGAIGITGNYEITDRIIARVGVTYTVVGGADRFSKKEDLVLRNLSFETKLLEFSALGEYYLFNLYERAYSPYFFAGLAIFHFDPYAYLNRDKYYLRPLSTEGQGITGYPDRKAYGLTQLALPFGGGIKFAVTENLRVGLELGFRKIFTDYLDDVSKNYIDPSDLLAARGPLAVDISYRGDEITGGFPTYPQKTEQRGNPNNKDAYYLVGLHITYRLGAGGGGEEGSLAAKVVIAKAAPVVLPTHSNLAVPMAYKNQQQFIDALEEAGELIRISAFVDPILEMAEITDRISKSGNGGKALLFENTGYDFPVLMNAYGSERRMCMALGIEKLDDIAKEIEQLFKLLSAPKEGILDKLKLLPKLNQFASWMPSVKSGKGACQEVIMKVPDITRLPVITCWPKDGGPFVTLPVIHTKDPNTHARNVGMYRMQIFGPDLTGMHWHKHKVSAKHFSEYKKLNKVMPIAVALGGDPVYAYAATAPLPENVDEYMLAGFIRKKKVELVKCITQPDIEVPADADFVIEGYVDPNDELIWEGPFGDHTGYYSLPDWYPRFHITAITHKTNAVYPATIVGIPPQEDAWLGKATERIFLAPIKMTMVPEIVDMEMPVEGVFHNLVITKISKDYAGQGQKVMNAMWGAGQMMFNKILVLTSARENDQQKLNEYEGLARQLFKNINPATDIYFSTGPMDVLDHSCSKLGFGGKMCIDGTIKMEEEQDDDYDMTTGNINYPSRQYFIDLKINYPEIEHLNATLLEKDIPCLLISVKKNRKGHIKELHSQLCALPEFDGIKMVLYVEHTVDANDLAVALWRFCNNLDPKRDAHLEKRTAAGHAGNKYVACMGFDGTRKTKELDNFQRDWPNIIVASQDTIDKIDRKWDQLGLGKFLPSPSLKFKSQLYGEEAAVDQ